MQLHHLATGARSQTYWDKVIFDNLLLAEEPNNMVSFINQLRVYVNSITKEAMESLMYSDGGYPGHSLLFKLLND